MSKILTIVRKWNAWYRVLRRSYGFSLMNSVRFGLWLARGGDQRS